MRLVAAPDQPSSTLTKRSREPRPPSPAPISTSSAIERMIAIPSPPSASSSSAPSPAGLRRIEALAVVHDLDHEPIGVELVADVDRAFTVGVGVANGVGAGLGQRELEIGERLVAERAESGDPGQGESAKGDVFRLRRNPQPNLANRRSVAHHRGVSREIRKLNYRRLSLSTGGKDAPTGFLPRSGGANAPRGERRPEPASRRGRR